ncbi:hypothetical protein [Natronobeatus ordinarius]|uniref:hypothetical protein n=1 Tax=Natronobeatus ordinarius TaxID=2963433 RepID=UPI0020CD6F6B|nr:hypothetical protein [Natronobeatus ordinarius]
MVPDTTHIVKDGGLVLWRNDDFIISVAEAESIVAELRRLLEHDETAAVFVDNRNAGGAWPADVNEVWAELMGDLYEQGVRCATVSPNVTNAMQINRLATDAGMDDAIKAFDPDGYQDAVDFVRAAIE